jgi:hypothetical protein
MVLVDVVLEPGVAEAVHKVSDAPGRVCGWVVATPAERQLVATQDLSLVLLLRKRDVVDLKR